VLDVLDAVTGATRRAYRGHEGIVRALVWDRDGRHVATAADDGRIRIVRLDEPGAITELVETFGEIDFSPDGTRLYVVSPSEIVVWDISTATTIARFASFGKFIHSAEVSVDGGRLVTGSYGHGIRVFDVATGAPMVIENAATTRSSHVAFAGEQVVACSLERLAGPAVLSPAELVHWTRLDDRGVLVDRGTWRFDVGFGGIALRVGGGVATVAAPGRKLHTYDLRDPNMPPRIVSIPAGARLLDARVGRALLYEGDELVCRDSSTGAELERIRCLRRPTFATLSHDGTGIAVAFSDQGIEVFCA
jgi:hypothetical protein